VTPNRQELAAATGMPTHDDAAVLAACRSLIKASGVGAVLATRSEQGMTLVDAAAVHHFPARAQEVYDVSGAGDTVAAAVAAALAAGTTLGEAAQFANTAAGVVVAGSAAGFAGKTRDRVGLFFLGAAGGSGSSSRPGRVGWLIGGVADIVSSSARNQPGRNLLQLARSLATDKANFHLGLVSRLGGNARGGRMVRRGILAANGG